jgi:hypothetical protein
MGNGTGKNPDICHEALVLDICHEALVLMAATEPLFERNKRPVFEPRHFFEKVFLLANA